MNNLTVSLLLVLGLSSTSYGDEVPAQPKQILVSSPELDALVQIALKENPAIKAAKHKSQAMKRKVSAAGAWKDPQFSYIKSNYPTDSFRANEQAMTGDEIKVAQAFPFPGKLARKREAAENAALASVAMADGVRIDLVKMVKATFFDLYAQRRLQEIFEEELKSLQRLEESTFAKYKTGAGILQDVAKVQLEIAVAKKRILEAQNRVETLSAKMNELLGRPIQSVIPPIKSIPDVLIKYKHLDPEQLARHGASTNPAVRVSKAKADESKQMLEYAELNLLPDFMVGVSYRFREETPMSDGQDFMSASIGINIPLYGSSKQIALQESAASSRQAYLAQTRRALNSLSEKIESQVEAGKLQQSLLELYEQDLLPAAEKALKSAQSAYKVSKVDFTAVIMNEKSLFRFRREYVVARAKLGKITATIEALLGKTPGN